MIKSFLHNRPKSRNPKINWGRGRLLPYESESAFVAKFCRLNGITYKEFKLFFDKYIGDPWSFTNLARLLDDDESVIAKLSAHELRLEACYGNFCYSNFKDDSHKYVSYCPECIKIGYHSTFHEFAWLAKCPIHRRTSIITESLPFSGKGSYYEKGIKRIEALMDSGGCDWLSASSNKAVERKINCKQFRDFTNWVHSVRELTRAKGKTILVVLWGSDYSSHCLDILLGRIASSTTIPEWILDLFPVRPKQQNPKIVDYPIVVVNKLVSILSKVKYEQLAWFYKMTVALLNEMPRYRELVLKAVKDLSLEGGNERCRSEWGFREYALDRAWVPVDPGGWPYWEIISPYELASIDLMREWTNFSLERDSNRLRQKEYDAYYYLANEFYKRGLVLPCVDTKISPDGAIHRGFPPHPMVRFNFDADLKGLLEDILYEEALAHIDELRAWLNSIASGANPYERNKIPSRGNLFLESEIAYLCTWT